MKTNKYLYGYHYIETGSAPGLTRLVLIVARSKQDAEDLVMNEFVRVYACRVEIEPVVICAVDAEVQPLDTDEPDRRKDACWSSERINRYACGLGSGSAREFEPYPSVGGSRWLEMAKNAFCSDRKVMSMIKYTLLHGACTPSQLACSLAKMGVLFPRRRMKRLQDDLYWYVSNPEDLIDSHVMDRERIYRIK